MRRHVAAAIIAAMLAVALWPCIVAAHDVSKRNTSFVQANHGAAVGAFMYVGANIWSRDTTIYYFLVGVIFFSTG